MVDTMRSLAELQTLLASGGDATISAQDVRDVLFTMANISGWSNYADTAHTQAAPLILAANTPVLLPNNKGQVDEAHKPADVTTFYDGSKILGRNGDDIEVVIQFTAVPQSSAATQIVSWLDIGGTQGIVNTDEASFPKGVGVPRACRFEFSGYNRDTWQANGASIHVEADGPVAIYGIRYICKRNYWGGLRPA